MNQFGVFPARTADAARIIIVFVGAINVLSKGQCKCKFAIARRSYKQLGMRYPIFGYRLD